MNDGVYTWRGCTALKNDEQHLCENNKNMVKGLWALISAGVVMAAMLFAGACIRKRKRGKHCGK